MSDRGTHLDWQPVPIPKGWDRECLWKALCKHLRKEAETKLLGSKVKLKDGYINISFKARKYDLPSPQINDGPWKRSPPPKMIPESDGLILSVRFEKAVDQIARPQLVNREHWTTFFGDVYLPDIKLYLNVNVDYGHETDKRLLEELCVPNRWLRAIFAGAKVLEDLPPGILAQRDWLLAVADANIRLGLVELVKKFPQLKKARNWKRISRRTQRGHIKISLDYPHRCLKSPPDLTSVPEKDRFAITVIIIPQSEQHLGQLKKVSLYPNVELIGQVHASAGNLGLNAALKKVVADALVSLKQFENKQEKLKSRYEKFNLKLAVELLTVNGIGKYQLGQSISVEVRLKNDSNETQVYPHGFGMTSMQSCCQIELITPDGKAWAAEAVPFQQFDNYKDIVLEPGQNVTIGKWDLSQLQYNPGHVFQTMGNRGRIPFASFAEPGKYSVRWWDGVIQGRKPLVSLKSEFELLGSEQSSAERTKLTRQVDVEC
ncbi:MAG: hypothetical protein IIB56_19915 [Planctomycetes bacterium]|nr:hypothetical protein [Planctomycetota bacterium]